MKRRGGNGCRFCLYVFVINFIIIWIVAAVKTLLMDRKLLTIGPLLPKEGVILARKDYVPSSTKREGVYLSEYAKAIAVPSFGEWSFIRSSLEYQVAPSSSSLGFLSHSLLKY